VRCCVWAQLLSRLLFIFFFLCLLCEVERPSASQSRRSFPARADGRSQQEPTVEQELMVDPSKSRRLILARADGRSQQSSQNEYNKQPHTTNTSSLLPPPLMRRQDYFTPFVDVHLRSGEQVSRTIILNDPAPGDDE
jgi:hypothetical protein